MVGRTSKLTPEVQARIVQAIAAGNYLEAAANYGGVDYATTWQWMTKGAQRPGAYRDFREAVLKAQAEAEVTVVAQWKQQIPENWAAARDFLARRFPERWGPKAALALTDKAGGPVTFSLVLDTGGALAAGAGTGPRLLEDVGGMPEQLFADPDEAPDEEEK